MSTPDARTQAVLTYCAIHASRSKFYADLLAKFARFGELTVRQLEAVERSMWQEAERLTAPANPVVESGMYENDEGIFRVKCSRETGNLYAMRFYPTANTKSERFVYEKGAVHKLRASDRMTVERARELGAEMSICCVCGADLTDAKSVAKGIGPVCEKKV